MSSVSNTQSSTGAAASAVGGAIGSAKDIQDRFLKLLVTQLQNQDPLNPMDNAQITTQMAQLSTVSGIEQLNSTLSNLSQSQASQAASLIGHTVVAPGSSIVLATGSNGVSQGIGGVELPSSADKVTVTIVDANNQPVRTIQMGKQDAGDQLFAWDGKTDAGTAAPAGIYTFSVAATAGGTDVKPVALAGGTVNSILMTSSGPQLSVPGLGNVNMSDVKEIL
jgi:flagellar basal-body rod modification protein FlgD